jgi:hypothetical protein
VIGVDVGEDRETVQGWATRLAIPFALLLDDRSETLRLFGLRGHPNTVLIDRENRVVGLVRGERDWQSVAARRLVQHLLQGGR